MPIVTVRRILLPVFACLAACAMERAAEAQSKSGPTALILLKARDSKVTPLKMGYSATGGGTVTVTQPTPETVIIVMSGVAGVGSCACETSHAALDFVLDQEFEIEFAPKTPQSGRLEVEARLYGLLRTEGRKGGGIAQFTKGFVSIIAGEEIGGLTLDPQTTACGEGLAITSVRGPVAIPVVPGCFRLHQEFGISATQPKCLIPRKSSADFAPPPTLDNRWIPSPDPFREANRSQNGFQVVIRLIQDPPQTTQVAPPPAPLPE